MALGCEDFALLAELRINDCFVVQGWIRTPPGLLLTLGAKAPVRSRRVRTGLDQALERHDIAPW